MYSRPQTSPNCTIREPIYNHTFDLTGLRAPLAHKVPGLGGAGFGGKINDFLELNVCGAMNKRCNGISAVAACYTTENGTEKVIGSDFALQLRDGQLGFQLNGGQCNSTANWTTRVQLVCTYDGRRLRRQPIELVAKDACSFRLVWYTQLACMPVPANVPSNGTCAVHDARSGQTFDLSALQTRSYV